VRRRLNRFRTLTLKIMTTRILQSPLMMAFSYEARQTITGKVPQYDGLSMAGALPVESVNEEYRWIYAQYPKSRVVKQELISYGRKHFDRLTVAMPEGEKRDFYFNITSFFGKW